MLIYALGSEYYWAYPNASVDQSDWGLWEYDNGREYLWNRIRDSWELHLEDFAANRDRIQPLLAEEDLTLEQKAVLLEILHRTDTFPSNSTEFLHRL